MTFYVAWVMPHETFDPKHHAREDVMVERLRISHGEGEFPLAVIETPVGALEASIETVFHAPISFLNASPRAFLSYQDTLGKVHVLFQGYLRPSTRQFQEEKSVWELTAEHPDARTQIHHAQQIFKTPPFWEPLLVNEEEHNTLEEILDARSILPHWDRCTGELTFSSILQGELSLMLGSQYFADNVTWQAAPPFLDRFIVEATVEWVQRWEGVSDLSPMIQRTGPNGLIGTLTPHGLIEKWWPRHHPLLNTGYTILESRARVTSPPATGGLDLYPMESVGVRIKDTTTTLPCFWVEPRLVVGWQYRQKRQETLTLSLTQDVVNGTAGKHKTLRLHLEDVSLDRYVAPWIADTLYGPKQEVEWEGWVYECRSLHVATTDFFADSSHWTKIERSIKSGFDSASGRFFDTERGRGVVRHLIEKAFAYMEASRRGDRITIDVPFEVALSFTCRHTITIQHPHRSDALLTGKVVFYELCVDGETGERSGRISFVMIRERTVESQRILDTLRQKDIIIREVEKPLAGIDDPRRLSSCDLIEHVDIIDDLRDQNSFLSAHSFESRGHVEQRLAERSTRVHMRLKDLRENGIAQRRLEIVSDERAP